MFFILALGRTMNYFFKLHKKLKLTNFFLWENASMTTIWTKETLWKKYQVAEVWRKKITSPHSKMLEQSILTLSQASDEKKAV